jgi:polyphenol oxidase
VEAAKKKANLDPEILQSKKFRSLDWLVHGFSTRSGGVSSVYGGRSLNLGFTKQDNRNAVERNRDVFLNKIGATTKKEVWPLVTLRQIHSDLIHCVNGVPSAPFVGDGLITAKPCLVVAIQTADCLPVILADTKNHTIGVFHAGWRGTVKRIVQKGVGEMRRHFGTDPLHIRAVIGPGVRACCYEVGQEVKQRFETQFAYGSELFREVRESDTIRDRYPLLFLTARAPGHSDLPTKLFLDLVEANRRQLLDAGVLAKNIEASRLCSSCRVDLLFSYRAERGITGRMMGAAGIRK